MSNERPRDDKATTVVEKSWNKPRVYEYFDSHTKSGIDKFATDLDLLKNPTSFQQAEVVLAMCRVLLELTKEFESEKKRRN